LKIINKIVNSAAKNTKKYYNYINTYFLQTFQDQIWTIHINTKNNDYSHFTVIKKYFLWTGTKNYLSILIIEIVNDSYWGNHKNKIKYAIQTPL